MWRTAKVTHLYGILAQKESNKELMKSLAFETLDYAKKAIELDANNPECHKWYAIAIGSLSDFITTKEKIANGNQFKKHLDIALGLKPKDPSLHHMLGRFCYEVSHLSWVERKVASALFSKVPESSFDDSLSHFRKAYDLRPEWKENILFISKILMSQKKYSEAIQWIDRGLAMKSVGEDDVIAHQQLDLLNSKASKYK
ncbi:unnamed protein product [Medioppia subpectinata]|uniref:Regulator of microtubule dynamics protein 1 n=1 Tax=Medioppia subpectinata TaxID=1979941 RepID=A0A7R9KZ81_9ACAR|nr:unnamed protein product [Medioppia subpectinata]CAG2112612.1 unnamed protein product [Medioppia subpectinata]